MEDDEIKYTDLTTGTITTGTITASTITTGTSILGNMHYDMHNNTILTYTGDNWITVNNSTDDRVIGTVLEDFFPTISELDKMREEYPALDQAWEKFKLVYRLVEDDYKNKEKNDK